MAKKAPSTSTGAVDAKQGLQGDLADIEKLIRTNRKAYNASDKMQARYRSLLDARKSAREQTDQQSTAVS
jgi:hypothetical protein